MRLEEIPKEKILLVKWRDVVEFGSKEKEGIKDVDDFERVTPIVESVGKIFGVKRGMVALQPEWCPMKDHQDYEGNTGESIQLMPAGCIEAVYELKVGKRLYKNPQFEEDEKDAAGPGGNDPRDGNRTGS